MVEFGYVGVYQKLRDDTVLLRTFCLLRDYSCDYENVTTKYSEHYRIYFRPGEVRSFKRSVNSYGYASTYDYYGKSNNTIDFMKCQQYQKAYHIHEDIVVIILTIVGCTTNTPNNGKLILTFMALKMLKKSSV